MKLTTINNNKQFNHVPKIFMKNNIIRNKTIKNLVSLIESKLLLVNEAI